MRVWETGRVPERERAMASVIGWNASWGPPSNVYGFSVCASLPRKGCPVGTTVSYVASLGDRRSFGRAASLGWLSGDNVGRTLPVRNPTPPDGRSCHSFVAIVSKLGAGETAQQVSRKMDFPG